MENFKVDYNGKQLTVQQFNATPDKEVAEVLNIDTVKVKAVKQAVTEFQMPISEVLEILNVVIKAPRKSRSKADAPIHKVAAYLKNKLAELKADSFNFKKGDVKADIFKTIFGISVDSYTTLNGFAKIKFLKTIQNAHDLESPAKVVKFIDNVVKGINRAFAVSGDNTAISTNGTYMETLQIERLENGTYTVHNQDSKGFDTLLKDAQDKRTKRLAPKKTTDAIPSNEEE